MWPFLDSVEQGTTPIKFLLISAHLTQQIYFVLSKPKHKRHFGSGSTFVAYGEIQTI